MPLIPVGGGVRVMPSLGYALAPYGAEWSVRTSFHQEQRAQSRERRITNITLRVGNTGASSTWGVSARAADVLRVRGLRIGLAVDIWRQPELLAEQTSDPQHMGAGAVATVVVPDPAECCDRDGRRAFTSRPATSRKGTFPANSSRAAWSYARASRSEVRRRPRADLRGYNVGAMSEPVLELVNASVKKGEATVLHGLTLKICAGEHTAILGPNGAGKSVLVRLLTHEERALPLPDDSSPVRVFGSDNWNVFELRPQLGHRVCRPASAVRQRQQRGTHHGARRSALGLCRLAGDPAIQRDHRRHAPARD